MKRTEMVKKSKDFQSIINYKHFYKNKYFVIYTSKPDNTILKPKFGIAVGKALGDAVNRNLMKRRVRNIIDNNKILFPNNHNYIIMIKRTSKEAKFSELNEALSSLIKEIKWKKIIK